jgi:type IV pilus assembly protein PilY1
LEVSDKSSSSTQSAYLIYDNGTTAADSTTSAAIKGRSRLKLGTASTTSNTVVVPAFTMGRAITDTDADNPRSGWYFNFPMSKEREVSNATVNGDKIVFGSLIPGASVAAGSCAASGGSGNEYSVDILTGNGTIKASTTGILGEPLVGEVPNAAVYSVTDSTGRRTKTPYKTVIQQGSTGLSAGATTAGTPVTVGRLSWRQINNYQDLHKTP